MKYFEQFDLINFDGVMVTNILTSIMLKINTLQYSVNYQKYTLTDGETPQMVSFNLYNTTDFYWVILLLNKVVDPIEDWLMTTRELQKYCKDKYGDDVEKVNHFINLTTNRRIDEYDSLHYLWMIDNNMTLPNHISPISNFQYENTKNEKHRNILVVNPEYIQDVAEEFYNLMVK